MDDLPMHGRVALVAGASKGIGAATAEAFADAGDAVVLAARDATALETIAQQIRAMLQSGDGTIVNMASLAGVTGVANLAAYVAGKAGIIGLTKVAALDYADQGIRVNVVAPGTILTHHLEAAGAEAQRMAALATPMRRIGSAAEVASVVLWLSSPGSSYLTGAVIPIDGGQSAGVKPPQMYRQGQRMQAQDGDDT